MEGNDAYFDPAATYTVRNPTLGFAGEYTLAGASINFSLTSQVSDKDTSPFTFTSDP